MNCPSKSWSERVIALHQSIIETLTSGIDDSFTMCNGWVIVKEERGEEATKPQKGSSMSWVDSYWSSSEGDSI